ncbi:MAG: hypothetical protein ACREGB_01290 [Candidatus Saccharimonadales bacterium]
MTDNSNNHPTPEAQPPVQAEFSVTHEQVQQAFTTAEAWRTETMLDPEFRAMAQEWGIKPGDTNDPNYWRAFATYGYNYAASVRTEQGPSLEMDAFEVLSTAPAYAFEQYGLHHSGFNSYEERESARQTTSYFNGLIRAFGENYPDARAADVLMSLAKVVNGSISNPTIRQEASNQLKATVRGAQHELGFGQILKAAGVRFMPATLEQDLSGIDYVVDDGRGRALFVDVKASLSEVEARGSAGVFAVKREKNSHRIVMFSMLRDEEFGGTFSISAQTATEKAPVLLAQLQKAAKVA